MTNKIGRAEDLITSWDVYLTEYDENINRWTAIAVGR